MQLFVSHCVSVNAALLEASVAGPRLQTRSFDATQELGSAATPHWISASSCNQRAAGPPGPPVAFQYSPTEKRGTRREGKGDQIKER